MESFGDSDHLHGQELQLLLHRKPVENRAAEPSLVINTNSDLVGPTTPNASYSLPPGPGGTNSILLKDEKDGYFEIITNNTWVPELLSIAFSMMMLAALVAILATLDKSLLDDWRLDVTLNAIISLIVTIMESCLVLPLTSAMGQWKWMKLQRPQPLQKFVDMDSASSGTYGRAKLIVTMHGGLIGMIGAVIGLLAFAIGPFSQQIVTYPLLNVTKGDAWIYRSINYNSTTYYTGSEEKPSLSMKAAIYDAMYGYSTNGSLKNPPFSCPSGNCTWDPFQTLGVCSQCTDVTNIINKSNCQSFNYNLPDGSSGTSETCTYILGSPYNISVNSDTDSLAQLNATVYFDENPLYNNLPPSPIVHFGVLNLTNPKTGTTEVLGMDCILQYCIQNVSAVVTNGILQQNITLNISTSTVKNPNRESTFGWVVPSNPVFWVDTEAALAISDFMYILNGTAYGTDDGGTYFYSDPMQAIFQASNLPDFVANIAKSMSVEFRSTTYADPISGISEKLVPFIIVTWAWLTLPVVVLLLTMVVLFVVMLENRRLGSPLWKSSALALLFHGLDDVTRMDLRNCETVLKMNKKAKQLCVQLMEGEDDRPSQLRKFE